MEYILVINSGSSTLKFKIFDFLKLKEVSSGIVERIGLKNSFFEMNYNKIHTRKNDYIRNHTEAINLVLSEVCEMFSLSSREELDGVIKVVGHRVVHGGEDLTKSLVVTPRIFKKIDKYSELAPLHNPANLEGISITEEIMPKVKNIAVFDTAFYNTLPDYAFLYALPYKFYSKYNIRRYGFHGISHSYVAREASLKLKKDLNKLNLITCHLGSGASVTAIEQGKAVDTSMGFTPLDGLVMSTRCGDIDPSIIFYLEKKLKKKDIEEILNKESGLLGISGTADMREILINSGYKVPGFESSQKRSSDEKKLLKLALQVFVYRVQKYISAYLGILGSVDAIVFTGGIGERSRVVRDLIIKGVKIDKKIKTLAIPANEELMIAREVKSVVKS